MANQLIDHILQKTEETRELYYHLILVLADPAAKYSEINQLAGQEKFGCINVNLELSRLMLPLTARQRALKISLLLNGIITDVPSETILLNHINILFDPALRQDPLRLLQNLSRRKTIVAILDGEIQGKYLTYSEPEHSEYRRYPTKELILISPPYVS